MSQPQVFEKTVEMPGKRLDAWLAESEPEHSRARWQALIKEGVVTVNGASVKPNFKLRAGDRVQWTIPEPVSSEVLQAILRDKVYTYPTPPLTSRAPPIKAPRES